MSAIDAAVHMLLSPDLSTAAVLESLSELCIQFAQALAEPNAVAQDSAAYADVLRFLFDKCGAAAGGSSSSQRIGSSAALKNSARRLSSYRNLKGTPAVPTDVIAACNSTLRRLEAAAVASEAIWISLLQGLTVLLDEGNSAASRRYLSVRACCIQELYAEM
jgi:hypothetical protein